MTFWEKMFERQKNPWNWLIELVSLFVLCYGLWLHDLVVIIISSAVLITGRFWFPKADKPIPWASKLIDDVYAWLFGPMNFSKLFAMLVGFVLFFYSLWNFWMQNLFLAIALMLMLIFYKAVLLFIISRK